MKNLIILDIFNLWNGIFTNKRTIPADLKTLYDFIHKRDFIGIQRDRANLNGDFLLFKNDLRKSLDHYYKNGQTK
jgi:hypothetical protein